MRKTTNIDYKERLDRVTNYVYEHLDEKLDLMKLARVACLSHYHWHRIYSAMRGESVATTVKRLRLFRAASQLANTDMDVQAIAKRAGYSSISTFNRAFKETIGQPPVEFRESGTHARFKEAVRMQSSDAYDVSIVETPRLRCASSSHSGPYIHIDQAMHRVVDAVLSLDRSHPIRMIGVFFDDPDSISEKRLRSRACLVTNEGFQIPPTLEEYIIPPGPCARLLYTGPYADMKDAYRWLFGVWLPNSGYEAGDRPAFEEYLNNPQEVSPSEILTAIHLPLSMGVQEEEENE